MPALLRRRRGIGYGLYRPIALLSVCDEPVFCSVCLSGHDFGHYSSDALHRQLHPQAGPVKPLAIHPHGNLRLNHSIL